MALREVRLEHEAPTDGYPLCLPAVRALPLQLADTVTVLVGENGSGKSTLVEAIAIAAGFNPEGGSFQVRFETTPTQAMLNGVTAGAQFILATHSPLLMAFPEALLYQLDADGLTEHDYDELEIVRLWRSFLDAPERFLHHLG